MSVVPPEVTPAAEPGAAPPGEPPTADELTDEEVLAELEPDVRQQIADGTLDRDDVIREWREAAALDDADADAEPLTDAAPPPGSEETPDDEPPPEPPLGLSEREFEKAAKALDRAVSTYRERVAAFVEATGQSLIVNKTDLEYVPGYIFHPDVRPLDDDQAAFARALLGMPIEPAFEQDPDASECSTCQGWGRVKTGSKVAGQNVANCPRCNGYGWVGSRPRESTDAPPPPPPGAAPDGVLTDAEQAGEDAWGTPRNHPDWGKSPQYRGPNWQAELEAYKAGEPAPVA